MRGDGSRGKGRLPRPAVKAVRVKRSPKREAANAREWMERGGRKAQDGYAHLSLNIGITRMPLCRRFVLGRLYVHEDIRTIARNTTFFTVPGLLYPLPRTERVERATMRG